MAMEKESAEPTIAQEKLKRKKKKKGKSYGKMSVKCGLIKLERKMMEQNCAQQRMVNLYPSLLHLSQHL